MFGLRQVAMLALGLGSLMFATGCQSSGPSQSAGPTASGQIATGTDRVILASAAEDGPAVYCPKCKITWVKIPVDGGQGRSVGYRTQESHECPDCKSAIETFFATGKLEHHCKTCGADMEICKTH